MINFDDVIKGNIEKHNPNCLEGPGHPYRILRAGGSGSEKTIFLFNLISHQPDIDKIYLFVKNPYKAKYQSLVSKRKSTGLKNLIDSKTFIKYSNDTDDIYENIQKYNSNTGSKILIVFDDIVADMLSNKSLNPIVTELIIRGIKLNISFILFKQSYFPVPKNIRLNSTHYFLIKI